MKRQVVSSSSEAFACTECATGLMRLHFITYFTWLNGELITVPNFPAWVCDVCGRREYDPKAISWLNIILSPNTGRSTLRKRVSSRTRPRSASRPGRNQTR